MIKSMTDIVSAETIPVLRWLGKRNWVHVEMVDEHSYQTRLLPVKNDGTLDDDQWFAVCKFLAFLDTIAHEMGKSGAIAFLEWQSISKVVAGGRKVFRPSVAQCEAMSHTDIRLKVVDYQQPFEAVLIDLPPEFVECQRQKYPDRAMPKCRHILSASRWHNSDTSHSFSISSQPYWAGAPGKPAWPSPRLSSSRQSFAVPRSSSATWPIPRRPTPPNRRPSNAEDRLQRQEARRQDARHYRPGQHHH